MGATGLSADPAEYRSRLREQSDDQLDTWAAELMRDVAIRRGVRKVIGDLRRTGGLDERELARVYAAGGGPPAAIGRDEAGELMVPATTVYCLVAGLRSQTTDARQRLIEYLVANFEDLVYV
ncbi:MAG TPA: hypothetical protein VF763_08675 [Candidatus Limnocylindrales bacterium]